MGPTALTVTLQSRNSANPKARTAYRLYGPAALIPAPEHRAEAEIGQMVTEVRPFGATGSRQGGR